MNSRTNERIIRELLSLPTAPFAEGHVIRHVRSFVRQRPSLSLTEDKVGNLLIHYRAQRGGKRIARPVCFAAHLDHPGFVVEGSLGGRPGRVQAVWRGGVLPEYFPGAKVRFFIDGAWVRGRVQKINTINKGGRTVVASAEIDVKGAVAPGSPGMWDFPDPVIRDGRLHARACDDLAGAAGMLACMHDLDARRAPGEAYFLFTRAEEVGFIGAMAACRLGTIPEHCVVVAVENSAELVHAKMGDGPILRVGDKQTTFTSAVTNFCGQVAEDLRKKNRRFTFQRRLMDGGTCESSAYCALGYDATGVCIALGNYHNMNKKSGKLGAEYIDMGDFHKLTRWFIAIVETPRRYTGRDIRLDDTLRKLQKEFNPLLRRTAKA
jgi:endoglucanase